MDPRLALLALSPLGVRHRIQCLCGAGRTQLVAASTLSELGGGSEVELDFDPVGAVAIALVSGKCDLWPLADREAEDINIDILGRFQITGGVGEVAKILGSKVP